MPLFQGASDVNVNGGVLTDLRGDQYNYHIHLDSTNPNLSAVLETLFRHVGQPKALDVEGDNTYRTHFWLMREG